MNVDIKSRDKWLSMLVLSEDRFPLIKVAYDPESQWHHRLAASNMKIATLRINGIEGRYGIDFDDCPRMEPDCITFNWLSIGKAQQIPAGSTLTMV